MLTTVLSDGERETVDHPLRRTKKSEDAAVRKKWPRPVGQLAADAGRAARVTIAT